MADVDRIKVLEEKMRYLYTGILTSKNFDVKGINIDFEQNLQNDKLNISSYDVFLQLDYQKEIDGWDSYSFTDKINFICKDVRDVISEYVVLPDGQIRQKPKAVLISPVSILKFNYIMDSLNLFELAARVDYE